jgi:hypothetical protein
MIDVKVEENLVKLVGHDGLGVVRPLFGNSCFS